MKYVFIDTVNGAATPANDTPDTATSKYHTSSSWPANGARWLKWSDAANNSVIQALADGITFYLTGSTDDTVVVTLPAFNGTSVNWTSVTAIGDSASAAGVDASKYLLTVGDAASDALNVYGTYTTTLQNLQVTTTQSNATTSAVHKWGVSGTLLFDSCYITNSSTSATTARTVYQDGGGTTRAYNSIFRTTNSTATSVRGLGKTTGNFEFYNCVIWVPSSAGSVAVRSTAGTADIFINCAVRADDDFNIADADAISYCATLDGDGTNAQTVTTWTDEFTDPDNGDFTIKAGSTKLIGTGTDNPAASAYLDDIAGTTRTSTWDIGAFEYVAGLVVTSVDADNGVYSAQADFNVIGTGLSAGQTFKIAGIACTELSFSGSTSAKLTAPDLFANNIKLGTTVEFKVYD